MTSINPESTIAESPEALGRKALEELRRKLLDLSARNNLINYRHPKSASLRVVDELPDQLVEQLLGEGTMRFAAIPEPSREELIAAGYLSVNDETGQLEKLRKEPDARTWGQHLGIRCDYEMPMPAETEETPDKHTDNAIQTLLYPNELDTRLKGIRQLAATAIQETGANILYLAFGFLQWSDPGHDNQRMAPLFLLPVTLLRGVRNEKTKAYEYNLNYSGEDLLPNLSLREKLREDFGLELPPLNDETQPEAYFQAVHDVVTARHPHWHVQRHVSLCLLNFSKLLMYLDLDPDHWPAERQITQHPIAGQFLGSEPGEQIGGGFDDALDIDRIETVHEQYPLIDDADSSQHSALIDAVRGRNLVIEGPPGTGKSQTITNLIAAALTQGKTVLFVAEKLAALEVVKSRLDRLELGHFCLELHSHKTQKKRVITDLGDRLNRQGRFRAPRELATSIERLERHQQTLNDHARRVNQPWGTSGCTPQEIFMRASRYALIIPVTASDCIPAHFVPTDFTQGTESQYADRAKALGHTFAETQRRSTVVTKNSGTDTDAFSALPWSGVCNAELTNNDSKAVCERLESWQQSLQTLQHTLATVCDQIQLEPTATGLPRDAVNVLAGELLSLAQVQGDEHYHALPSLQGEALTQARQYLQQTEEIGSQYQSLQPLVAETLLQAPEQAAILQTNQLRPLAQVFKGSVVLAAAESQLQAIQQSQTVLNAIVPALKAVNDQLTAVSLVRFKPTQQGFADFLRLLELTAELPVEQHAMRDKRFDDDSIDPILQQLISNHAEVSEQQQQVSQHFNLEQLPAETELSLVKSQLDNGGFFRWFKPSWWRARKTVLTIAATPDHKLKTLWPALPTALSYLRALNTLESHAPYQRAFGDHFVGLKTAVTTLVSIRSWYRAIRKEYGIGFGEQVAIGTTLLETDHNLLRALASLSEQGATAQLRTLLEQVQTCKTLYQDEHPIHRQDQRLQCDDGLLQELQQRQQALTTLRAAIPDQQLTLTSCKTQLQAVEQLSQRLQTWQASQVDANSFGGQLEIEVGLYAHNAPAIARLKSTVLLATQLADNTQSAGLADHARTLTSAADFKALQTPGNQLQQALEATNTTQAHFADLTQLDTPLWLAQAGTTHSDLYARNDHALKCAEALSYWLDYLRTRQLAQQQGLGAIVNLLETEQLPPTQTKEALLAGLYHALATAVIAQDRDLENFSGPAQEATQQQFCEADEALKGLQRRQIASIVAKRAVPAGTGVGRIRDYSEAALIKHECSKKTRHIPLRQLVKRAPKALLGLKPCFMMGPMSVAQYLEPGAFEFDLVIMDEASQIRPQDALGAIARGKQLVVVGDPKQMPPTNFFDRLSTDDEEDEDAVAMQLSESILDAAIPMFAARRLRWHYRSEHESLIAFSNASFYDGDLVLFPSPVANDQGYGIHYERVENGHFVNQRNSVEARAVVNALRQQLTTRPTETVGIVAMSSKQRDAIDAQLEAESRADETFKTLLDKDSLREESLFIKNLENVQGDERDVILISMTYGPMAAGSPVPQRFGPINQEVGWRRLNVLFTRSRKRMCVFSSMDSHDILIEDTSSRGKQALRDFLSYCETGVVASSQPNQREPDSDFERAVIKQLEDAGFSCVPQLGAAGYFIDVVVRDPGNPGRYLMGIECDGATYHSAKSARDRDRLRQQVLERLGWRIARIWSTDWFRNPHGALKPILDELHSLKTQPQAALEAPVNQQTVANDGTSHSAPASHKAVLSQALTTAKDLRSALTLYQHTCIAIAYPDTPEDEKLLRPAMLEALLEFQPCDRVEFRDTIPSYLRQQTNTPEAQQFLDDVLDIVNQYATK